MNGLQESERTDAGASEKDDRQLNDHGQVHGHPVAFLHAE
jgi:hypothetical protein